MCVSGSEDEKEEEVKYITKPFTDEELLSMLPDQESASENAACQSEIVHGDEINMEERNVQTLPQAKGFSRNKNREFDFRNASKYIHFENWKPPSEYDIHIHPVPGLEKNFHPLPEKKEKNWVLFADSCLESCVILYYEYVCALFRQFIEQQNKRRIQTFSYCFSPFISVFSPISSRRLFLGITGKRKRQSNCIPSPQSTVFIWIALDQCQNNIQGKS